MITKKNLDSFFCSAIGSALPPDYSYTTTLQDNIKHEREKTELARSYEPNPVDTSSVTLIPALEDFVKAYAESVHDQWSYAKVCVRLIFDMLLKN